MAQIIETQKAYDKRCLGAMGTLASKIDAWKSDATAAVDKSGATMVDYYRTSRGVSCPMGFAVWK